MYLPYPPLVALLRFGASTFVEPRPPCPSGGIPVDVDPRVVLSAASWEAPGAAGLFFLALRRLKGLTRREQEVPPVDVIATKAGSCPL